MLAVERSLRVAAWLAVAWVAAVLLVWSACFGVWPVLVVPVARRAWRRRLGLLFLGGEKGGDAE